MFSLGTDEAGYGPNLGPLVVSATLWNGVPESVAGVDDSKRLYNSATGSLERLEHGVFGALLATDGNVPATEKDLWERLCGKAPDVVGNTPWLTSGGLARASAEPFRDLRDVRATVLQPAEFNRRLERDGNKSTLLTRTTLELAKRLIDTLPGKADVVVYGDKHGGRNAYAAPVYECYPDAFLEILEESRALSVYRLTDERERRLEMRFEAKGEKHPQTALASMFAKYLRERAMRTFNAFWAEKVPGLAPTAGYPEDAKRFYREIDAERERLGIDPDSIWRKK